MPVILTFNCGGLTVLKSQATFHELDNFPVHHFPSSPTTHTLQAFLGSLESRPLPTQTRVIIWIYRFKFQSSCHIQFQLQAWMETYCHTPYDKAFAHASGDMRTHHLGGNPTPTTGVEIRHQDKLERSSCSISFSYTAEIRSMRRRRLCPNPVSW